MSKNYVKVPVSQLQKLERERLELYGHLSTMLTERQMAMLSTFTCQMWQVANRKVWTETEFSTPRGGSL